mgnify:CR=1 FL=1
MNEKMIANKISGLSSKEVEERLKNGQNNKMVDEKPNFKFKLASL